jgi:hypothetical protein
MVFSVTTEVVIPTVAAAHSGGWTESLWTGGNSYISIPDQNALITARARLLPKQASIVGIRQGLYTISGNKLLPQGTSGRKTVKAGLDGYNVNLPQDSLELSGTSATTINSNRFRIGCLPDEVVQKGEFAPNTFYTFYLNEYMALLAAGANAWSFICRKLSNPTARVMSITPGLNATATIVVSAPLTPTAGTSYLRLHRVYDNVNEPVKGAFLVTTVNSPTSYVISGYSGGTVVDPSGTTRIDEIILVPYGLVTVSRAVVKKIGRPSSSYRGRASNRTRA